MEGSIIDLSKYRFQSSELIDTAFRLREKADYQDFVIISKDQAIEQIKKAEKVIGMIKPYLEECWNK